MLSHQTVREIERLLQEGQLSQRQIAQQLGISRGSIATIARGNWSGFAHDEESTEPAIPPRRCGGCGGLVVMPCRLCAVRALKRSERVRRGRIARYLAGTPLSASCQRPLTASTMAQTPTCGAPAMARANPEPRPAACGARSATQTGGD